MDKFTQQFANATENCSAAISAFATLANKSLENAQKIAALQCEAASCFIECQANATKDLIEAKTPAQATNVLKDFATSSVETTLEKTKEMFNVLSKSQVSFKDAANTSFKNASDSLLNSIDQVAKVNPSWSKAATESVQKLIDATNKASETMEKVAAQVSTIANKNVEAAASATLNSLKKAGSTSRGFAASAK
jgi:phasin family protein